MSKSYYNTTNEKGATLFDSERKAQSQEEKILTFFQTHLDQFSPTSIKRLVLPNSPLTSIRRAITNLTKAGKLKKTGIKVLGTYGKLEHCWVIA